MAVSVLSVIPGHSFSMERTRPGRRNLVSTFAYAVSDADIYRALHFRAV